MKRIVVLGPSNNIRVIRWIKFLLRKGWKVDLIYSSRIDEIFKHPFFSNHNIYPNYKKRNKKSDIKKKYSVDKFSWTKIIRKSNLKSLRFDILQLIAGLIYGIKIYHLVERIKPDSMLIHSSASYIRTFWYILISKLLLKKIIPVFIVIWGRNSRTRMFFYIEKYIFQKSTKIMSNITLRNIYVSYYGIDKNKFVITNWGINLRRNYPPIEEEVDDIRNKYNFSKNDIILFHNRLFTPQYNIEDFFDIIPQCVKSIPNLKLLLVRGLDESTFYIDKTLKAFEDRGLAKYTHYIPRKMSYDEMRILYGLSFAVVSPIEHDGFCASIMEAMACGGIPILYSLKGYTEKLENNQNALFAPIGDTEAFASNIVYLYRNPELRDKIKKNNFELVKKIGDENINFGKVVYEMEKHIES